MHGIYALACFDYLPHVQRMITDRGQHRKCLILNLFLHVMDEDFLKLYSSHYGVSCSNHFSFGGVAEYVNKHKTEDVRQISNSSDYLYPFRFTRLLYISRTEMSFN